MSWALLNSLQMEEITQTTLCPNGIFPEIRRARIASCRTPGFTVSSSVSPMKVSAQTLLDFYRNCADCQKLFGG